MTKSTCRKKWTSIIVAFTMMIVCLIELAAPAAAATWKTGNFPKTSKNTGAITVTLTNKKKDAYIKIHTYAAKNYVDKQNTNTTNVKERSCSVDVTMRDVNGKWIWENNISTCSGGKKMRLGCNHSVYKLYLKHTYGVHCWDVGHFCPIYWGVECVSNCSVR